MHYVIHWRHVAGPARAAGVRCQAQPAERPTSSKPVGDALATLDALDGYLVLAAAAMRSIRSAMPWLGMAASPPYGVVDHRADCRGGLPVHTLRDPGAIWDVTDRQCELALLAWRTAVHAWYQHLDLLLDGCGLTTARRLDTWRRWIGFLTDAADHGGYLGHGIHPAN